MNTLTKRIIGIVLFIATLAASISAPLLIFRSYVNTEDESRRTDGTGSSSGDFIYPEGSSSKVSIFLEADEHCSVVSANPATTPIGGKVSFDVVFENNYTFNGSDELTYNKGKIIIENCTEDKSYSLLSAIKKEHYSFELAIPSDGAGTATSLTTNGSIANGQDVTVNAKPSLGNRFICWTVGESLEDGGSAVSYEQTYRFTASRDIKIHPNFAPINTFAVRYNLGDGSLNGDNTTHYFTEYVKYYPHGTFNLRPELGDFIYDGHTLIGYGTKQGAGGAIINTGGIVKSPSGAPLMDIYAHWSAWNPLNEFEFETHNGEAAIKKYNGTSSVLSLPAYVDGLPVTSIMPGAISNISLSQLIIPPTVTMMSEGAVSNCPTIASITVFDNFKNIRDNAFVNCGEIEAIRIDATSLAYFPDDTASVLSRWRSLLSKDQNKRTLLTVGGEALLYGLDSEWMTNLLSQNYFVINMGGLSSAGVELCAKAFSAGLQGGDILLHVIEVGTGLPQNNTVNFKDIAAFEGCYNLLCDIDVSDYCGFFDAISDLNTLSEGRSDRPQYAYENENEALLDGSCDIKDECDEALVNDAYGINVSADQFTQGLGARLNAVNDTVKSCGASYFVGIAPFFCYDESGSIHDSSILEAAYLALKNCTSARTISVISNYLFTRAYFFDSIFHLNKTGSMTYTNMVYNDLMDALGNVDQKVIYHTFDYFHTNTSMGTVECNRESGQVLQNQRITINSKPLSGYRFVGYTKDSYAVDGGEFISYNTEYSFMINEDISLYANFVEEKYYMIRYFLEGGVVAEDGVSGLKTVLIDKTVRPCVNLIGDTGIFVKDGHTLLEYNTMKDQSGTAINPGGLTAVPPTGVLDVYAAWSEWSSSDDFTYNISSGKATITSYTGNDGVLSLPAKLEGITVTAVAASAVVGKGFHTLVIPASITTLADKAFIDCKQFDTLYINDGIVSAQNTSFYNCKAFSNLRLNATMLPRYSISAESISTRWEQLLTRDPDQSLMILVGGSSSLYGFDSPHIQTKLSEAGYDIRVINCGTNAGGTGMLYIEALSYFMLPGDYVVNAPEFYNIQMGSYEIMWRCLRATEGGFNIFRYVDFSKYTNFLKALVDFNTDKKARPSNGFTVYEKKNTSLTDYYCDLNSNRLYKSFNQKNGFAITAEKFTDSIINNMNHIIGIVEQRGITYYLSSPPVYELNSSGKYHADNLAPIDAYYQKAVSRMACAVISHPKDYIFPVEVYYDSYYHLISTAATDRSQRLVNDLLKQFSLE